MQRCAKSTPAASVSPACKGRGKAGLAERLAQPTLLHARLDATSRRRPTASAKSLQSCFASLPAAHADAVFPVGLARVRNGRTSSYNRSMRLPPSSLYKFEPELASRFPTPHSSSTSPCRSAKPPGSPKTAAQPPPSERPGQNAAVGIVSSTSPLGNLDRSTAGGDVAHCRIGIPSPRRLGPPSVRIKHWTNKYRWNFPMIHCKLFVMEILMIVKKKEQRPFLVMEKFDWDKAAEWMNLRWTWIAKSIPNDIVIADPTPKAMRNKVLGGWDPTYMRRYFPWWRSVLGVRDLSYAVADDKSVLVDIGQLRSRCSNSVSNVSSSNPDSNIGFMGRIKQLTSSHQSRWYSTSVFRTLAKVLKYA